MKKLCNRTISASEISEFLNVIWQQKDFYITKPVDYSCMEAGTISFTSSGICEKNVMDSICIVNKINLNSCCHQIVSDNPELDFYRVVNEFFMDQSMVSISKDADVAEDAIIENNVSIGAGTFIGSKVSIGTGTQIGRNVYIADGISVGKYCLIKDNAIIGSQGYHFVFDNNVYLEKPCFGTILVGNDVLVGHNSTIERPSFGRTIIGDNTKIDDLVNIGSTCSIGNNTLISAGAILCHNVSIGNHCVLSPNASVRENVAIKDDVTVGLGSVVVSDIDCSKIYAGNPAHEIKTGGK